MGNNKLIKIMKYQVIALLFLGLMSETSATQIEAHHHHKHHSKKHHNIQSLAAADCEPALEISGKEMNYQMDMFSRNFNKVHYDNAAKIADELKTKLPQVHTWELYDAAFSFPRVRRYEAVQNIMNDLEHFQDNLNTNISNSKLLEIFIGVGKAGQAVLNEKYHNGEFADPAKKDPKDDE